MQQKRFTIAENAPVARGTYRLRLAVDTAAITAPGQFADIRLAGYFLRRPVSVCSWSDGALTLYYKVAGAGTAQLSTLAPGTELDLLVGLGNGFDTAPAGARPLLVGGGVGASPLYGLAQQLVAEGRSPLAVLGFRTAAEVLLADAFEALGIPVTVVTEDGTMGARGFVTDALPEGGTYVYACGPMPMLQALCSATPLDGQLSLEARMGCGFGACMGCTCETTHGSKRVCKDGPVFTKEEILWPQQP